MDLLLMIFTKLNIPTIFLKVLIFSKVNLPMSTLLSSRALGTWQQFSTVQIINP